MKIVHVIIAANYKDGLGYQENILPAKHLELGLDTFIISFDRKTINGNEYTNSDGVKVIMLPLNRTIFKKIPVFKSFTKQTKGLYEVLNKISPDIIFVHNLSCFESLEICKYCRKNKKVKLFVDQHEDYYNSPITSWKRKIFIKNIFGKKENLVDEVISQENVEKIELEKVPDLEEKVNKVPKTLDEKIAAVDLVPDISDEERLKRKLRIYEAHDRKVREQRMEQIEVKRLTDVDYYKDIYNKVNEGIIGVEDLTSDEFSKILKMQKLEYEVITKKLKDAMDNL